MIITSLSLFFGEMISGCQPRRHSSPIVGFCVQRIGTKRVSPVTQILQPMHSRISSTRPSFIFVGRNGSAIDGLAAPMKSITPRWMAETIESGEVYRPTPTTGFVVNCLTNEIYFSWCPSLPNLDVIESLFH